VLLSTVDICDSMSSFVLGFVDFGHLLKHYMLKFQKVYKVDMQYVYLLMIGNTYVTFIINRVCQN